jgi:DNA mismatch endonuclease Vsr
MTDIMSKAKRKKVMKSIRSRDTTPEKAFKRQYPAAIMHPDWLPYRPDFLLYRTPIFLDSKFWHCKIGVVRYGLLSKYWQEKLFRNLVRDQCAIGFYRALRECCVRTYRIEV